MSDNDTITRRELDRWLEAFGEELLVVVVELLGPPGMAAALKARRDATKGAGLP